MSALREDQKTNVTGFMNVIWTQLIKPYYNPEDEDAWWEEMIARVNVISKTYCQDDPRLRKILAGFANGVSEVYRTDRVGTP